MNCKNFSSRAAIGASLCAGVLALCGAPRAQAQVSLTSVVDLALRNSTQVRVSRADVQRALAGLSESKDVYLPSITLGSSLGYSYGFPVGQPSIYNLAGQSLVYSFSQPDYIRAAHAALDSAKVKLQDEQEQVALDTSLAYIQLDYDLRQLAALDEEKQFAETLVSIEQQRVEAGVDPRVELTRAQLSSAQVDQKHMHLEDDRDEMRQKIAHLTGLPDTGLTTQAASIPADPNFTLNTPADVAASPGVRAADLNAKSKTELSFGDAKQSYRPQFGLGAEYNRYAEFNNYNEYYLRFQHNNFDVGVQITFPIFDASKRAKARESAADAVRAHVEAEQAKNTVSEQVLTLRHSIRELQVQRRVAQLQADLSQEQLATIETQLQGSNNATPGSQQVTPKDAALAHIDERERFQSSLDAQFQLQRTELSLLRSLGNLENWVHSADINAPQP